MINQRVWLFSVIDGYNPPNDYLIIDSKDKAMSLLDKADIAMDFIPSYTITNGLAEIVLSYKSDPKTLNATVIAVADNNTNEIVIGNVITRKPLNDSACMYTVNIDWYTSSLLTQYINFETPVLPVIIRGNERRSITGRYRYSDDGIKPKNKRIEITTYMKVDYSALDDSNGTDVFGPSSLLIYHDANTNTDHWLHFDYNYDSSTGLKNVWLLYCNMQEINSKSASRTFNPKNITFFGLLPVSFGIIEYLAIDKLAHIGLINSVLRNKNNEFMISHEPFGATRTTLRFQKDDAEFMSTDAVEYTINDIDGMPIYQFPKGVAIKSTKVAISVNTDINTPSVSFKFENWVHSDNISFTLTARPLTSYIDTEQVYNAEQRVYNQQMRSLQAVNNLVGGLTSASTEGALVGGFSRKGNPYMKGGLAAGIGIASAVAGYGYQVLYADKEQTKIEDRQARVTADTALFSSSLNVATLRPGLYITYYDAETISIINDYHALYGYQSDNMIKDKPINAFAKGYIKADIIMKEGLRKEQEDYICKMFGYGVTFNE